MRTCLIVTVLALTAACSGDQLDVDATYDTTTGKLASLAADLNADGKVDTWTYMDGTTLLRTEQDLNADGKVDRWEFAGEGGNTTKVAVSRRNTGEPDIWTYLDAEGQPIRIESASAAKIDRVEYYAVGALSRVEEDTDGDGRVDKWEQHQDAGLASVEFDHDRDGTPDERIQFGVGGKVLSRQKIGR